MGQDTNKIAEGPATPEQNKLAVKLHGEGVKFQHIMDQTGLSMTQADRAIYTHRAVQRLKSLDVSAKGFSDAALFALGAPSVDREHDAVFAAVAVLVRDAALTQAEIKTLTDVVATRRSDDAAVAYVAEQVTSMTGRIAAVTAGTWTGSKVVGKTTLEKATALLARLSAEEKAKMLAELQA